MSKECIDREAHCKKCIHYDICDSYSGLDIVTFFPHNEDCEYFKSEDDYAEVQHGEWFDYHGDIKCSVCGAVYADEIRFMNKNHKGELLQRCPNCGAKMDGKGEGE